MTIPLVDLVSQHAEVADEVQAGLAEVFASAAFVGGPQVARFEEEYAAFSGTVHCVGVANGTDALELALRAAGIGPGDEVVLPANTFVATAEAVCRAGGAPVLVDCDPEHLLMDTRAALDAVTPRTKAVVPVDLFGQAPPVEDLDALREAGVAVVEDAAQSQGATRAGRPTGALGVAAATSFYPGKNLGAYGDAGAVTTDDPELARRVRWLANHGGGSRYQHDLVGCNSRMDTVQAVVLLAKLKRLSEWNAARADAADRYQDLLRDVPEVRAPSVLPGNTHVWHLYVVRVPQRDRVLARMHEHGIGAGVHYPRPVHLTNAFAGLAPAGAFPVAEEAADQILSLPLYPHITEAAQQRVVDCLKDALR